MYKFIIPGIIFILQILGYLFLYFNSKLGHADIPIAWILFNFLGIFNFIVIILSYFFYFRIEGETNFLAFSYKYCINYNYYFHYTIY